MKKADVTSEIMVAEAIVSLAASLKAKGESRRLWYASQRNLLEAKGWITLSGGRAVAFRGVKTTA